MRRPLLALALIVSGFVAAPANAQGLLDLLGGADQPERAPRPARDIPRGGGEAKKPAVAKTKKPARTQGGAPASPTPATAAANVAAPPPPYQAQLVRLSEILGSLAYLRDLCPEKDGADWRDKMSALLEAEAPVGPRRDAYTAAFNRGFRSYELTYRACTDNAKVVTARFLDEAAKITHDVSYRYGSP